MEALENIFNYFSIPHHVNPQSYYNFTEFFNPNPKISGIDREIFLNILANEFHNNYGKELLGFDFGSDNKVNKLKFFVDELNLSDDEKNILLNKPFNDDDEQVKKILSGDHLEQYYQLKKECDNEFEELLRKIDNFIISNHLNKTFINIIENTFYIESSDFLKNLLKIYLYVLGESLIYEYNDGISFNGACRFYVQMISSRGLVNRLIAVQLMNEVILRKNPTYNESLTNSLIEVALITKLIDKKMINIKKNNYNNQLKYNYITIENIYKFLLDYQWENIEIEPSKNFDEFFHKILKYLLKNKKLPDKR
jgi:hypothetical protein